VPTIDTELSFYAGSKANGVTSTTELQRAPLVGGFDPNPSTLSASEAKRVASRPWQNRDKILRTERSWVAFERKADSPSC
jgi:hypothetical protein